MVWISDSQKYNFQINSIRILALGPPSWFWPSFNGYCRAHFNNLPYKENVIKPGKNPFFQTGKCYLLCWEAVLAI